MEWCTGKCGPWQGDLWVFACCCCLLLRQSDCLAGHHALDSSNLGQSDEVVGDHSEGEGGAGSVDASDLEAGDAADGLGPAECFLDTLADAQGSLVAVVACGAAVDQCLADLAELADGAVDGDVRCDLALAQSADESRSVRWTLRCGPLGPGLKLEADPF